MFFIPFNPLFGEAWLSVFRHNLCGVQRCFLVFPLASRSRRLTGFSTLSSPLALARLLFLVRVRRHARLRRHVLCIVGSVTGKYSSEAILILICSLSVIPPVPHVQGPIPTKKYNRLRSVYRSTSLSLSRPPPPPLFRCPPRSSWSLGATKKRSRHRDPRADRLRSAAIVRSRRQVGTNK